MAIFYDTNILLLIARDKTRTVRSIVNPNQEPEYISIVSGAELRSLAIQFGWAAKRQLQIDALLDDLNRISVDSDVLVNRYVELDVFSQGKHPSLALPGSARNMGKNDLWIGATASLLGLQLITTDLDFQHLDPLFLRVALFDQQTLFPR